MRRKQKQTDRDPPKKKKAENLSEFDDPADENRLDPQISAITLFK